MRIDYWKSSSGKEDVKLFISQQPTEAQEEIAMAIERLGRLGLGLIKYYPKSISPLTGCKQFYELRVRYKKLRYRIIFKMFGSIAFLLVAFIKKEQKTRWGHIELAKNRAREIEKIF